MSVKRRTADEPEYFVFEYLSNPLPKMWHGWPLEKEASEAAVREVDPLAPLVTPCLRGALIEARMDTSMAVRLDPDDVDFHLDEAFGRIQIRQSDGTALKHLAEIPGIGAERRKVLLALMNRPGEFLCPRQLAALTGNTWLRDPRNVAGCVRALRRAFGETGTIPFYFITRRHPYAVAWSDRSWRHIEPVALPLNGNGREE